MIISSAIIIVYGILLFGCFCFLIRSSGRQKEQAFSNEITPDAAKRAFQSIKEVDRKESDRPSELSVAMEIIKSQLDRRSISDSPQDKQSDVDQAKIDMR